MDVVDGVKQLGSRKAGRGGRAIELVEAARRSRVFAQQMHGQRRRDRFSKEEVAGVVLLRRLAQGHREVLQARIPVAAMHVEPDLLSVQQILGSTRHEQRIEPDIQHVRGVRRALAQTCAAGKIGDGAPRFCDVSVASVFPEFAAHRRADVDADHVLAIHQVLRFSRRAALLLLDHDAVPSGAGAEDHPARVGTVRHFLPRAGIEQRNLRGLLLRHARVATKPSQIRHRVAPADPAFYAPKNAWRPVCIAQRGTVQSRPAMSARQVLRGRSRMAAHRVGKSELA